MTVGYPSENLDGGGTRGRPPFETMFYKGKVGQPFERDPKTVELLKELKMIQQPGPTPGRLEEINKLTIRFGLGEEALTEPARYLHHARDRDARCTGAAGERPGCHPAAGGS